jgi:hypothetical protein
VSNIAQDELDAMLQGQGQGTPSASQAGTDDTGSNPENPIEGAGGQTEEEIAFSKLSGSAQDRFRRIYRERQELLSERERLRAGQGLVPPPPPQYDPQVKEAIAKLDSVGVATKDFVQQQIQQTLSQKTFYDELGKLETEIDGHDGRPKFTREEYSDYITRYPQYQNYLPMDVYEKMYREELEGWKSSGTNQNRTQSRQTLRPTRTSGRDTDLTPEEIEDKLKSLPSPAREQWYEKNLSKINEAMGRK